MPGARPVELTEVKALEFMLQLASRDKVVLEGYLSLGRMGFDELPPTSGCFWGR